MNQAGRRRMTDEQRAAKDVIGLSVVIGGLAGVWVLYERYNFSEPWDGPNNSKLHAEVVDAFRCYKSHDSEPETWTNYVAVVGPHTLWPGAESVGWDDVPDGASRTILVVETTNSGIHWMEPRDLEFDKMPMSVNPEQGRGISSNHRDVALVAFADQHTTVRHPESVARVIRALLTRNGGEDLDLQELWK